MQRLHRSRKALAFGSFATLLALALSWGVSAQVPAVADDNVTMEAVQIQPNLYMIVGAGSNITVQTGADGTVLVDAGTAAASDQVLAEIKKITDQPIRYIIDTSADADAIGGSGKLSKAGRNINWTGPIPRVSARGISGTFTATILAPVSVLLKVSAPTGSVAPYPSDVWPSQSFSENRKYIYFNHEAIEIYRQAAHDDTDSIVFFRASDVISAGAIIDAGRFPMIDVKHGGSIQGEIDALNHIIDLSDRPIPFVFGPGGTYIVPAHGRLYQQADVVQYRDMMVEIRDIVQSMINRGMKLAQIQAASPCLAYRREYGRDTGPWTTNDFVQAVYESLTQRKPTRKGKG